MIRFALTLLAGVLLTLSTALATGTAAGTQLINVASVTFLDPYNGQPTQTVSNAISTTVQAVCAVSLTPDLASAAVLPGEQTLLRYTVTNAGNAPFTLPVSASSSGTLPAPLLTLYQDVNGNGQLDPDEAQLSSISLPADGNAKLLLLVQTDPLAKGDTQLTLTATCGEAGTSRASAGGTVTLSPPPALKVSKTFTPSLIRPGTQTSVNISTQNDGQGTSREVILTDLLSDEVALGLTFVPGSARTSVGTLEYTSDGTTWAAQEPPLVRGVRVRVPSLAPGAGVNLSFNMLAATSADGKRIPNTATATTFGQTVSDTAQADVRYQPGVAIGPVGTPLAPEGSAADAQTKALALVGQPVCFDHTILNTGDVQDNFTITISYPQGGATAALYGADGQPLIQPLPLDVGQSALIRICYTPSQTGPLETLITAAGTRGESNATRDLVTSVETGLPELKKSYAAASRDGTPIAGGATVAVGDTITYTLSVVNPYTRPLTGAVASDPVPTHLDVQRASDGGSVSGLTGAQTVTWNLGTLAPGEARTLTIVTTVSDRAVDGEQLKNTFTLVTTELPNPTGSNTVVTPVWNAALLVTKAVSNMQVTYGDRVTYTLRVRNASATTAIESAVVTDTPAKGLLYLTGSSTLGGLPLADPTLAGGKMQWQVGSIPAGGEIIITYDMRVTPDAGTQLDNVVQVVGVGAGGAAKAIASNTAHRSIQLDPLKFAPLADLIGTVFVDRNRNGLYDAGLDTPVPRARVILSSGRMALTDALGRYHFSNVAYGSWALRLDPNTTPYPPLRLPQEGGLTGTQTVHVRGLTSVDFPLTPLGGDIDAIRQTSLVKGDLLLEKTVYAVPGGYVVSLKLTTPSALSEFNLLDPLPAGAVLKDGSNSWNTTLPVGETYLTYHFDWTGEAREATTDPVVSWRY